MSQTDRELLELVAKAEGRPAPYDQHGFFSAWVGDMENGHWWDPLHDDGDALRLAVKLMLTVSQSPFGVEARVLGSIPSFEGWGDDRPASTRRAIVSAAAAIGRAMP